ncbi:hypothetical protein L596_012775 [Steinernema carpocapsae]|uniref:Uncharacterized protein n=1 Tax=Steinernema carpocapsae TaxID=34508 RepID=A0A4U5NYR0_STECR|nr:hypothetical protein L596_012775 [Steinernema carpocapsae]
MRSSVVVFRTSMYLLAIPRRITHSTFRLVSTLCTYSQMSGKFVKEIVNFRTLASQPPNVHLTLFCAIDRGEQGQLFAKTSEKQKLIA